MHDFPKWQEQDVSSSLVNTYASILDYGVKPTLSIQLLNLHRDQNLPITIVKLNGILNEIEQDELI